MILFENHKKKRKDLFGDPYFQMLNHSSKLAQCWCSYCHGSSKLHYGLNIPESKAWNSWWVIKYWDSRYIRFTIPFLKK